MTNCSTSAIAPATSSRSLTRSQRPHRRSGSRQGDADGGRQRTERRRRADRENHAGVEPHHRGRCGNWLTVARRLTPCPALTLAVCETVVTLAGRSCVARQEPYIPGALSILPGTVPGQVRGLGYMVPTYFRRELRDRVLQRPSRLRTYFLFCKPVCCRRSIVSAVILHCAKADYPVRRSVLKSRAPWNTGPAQVLHHRI